jgi:oligopeptide transport system substrate-binding protein
MAIDKNQIGALRHGGETAATSLVPPQVLGYSKQIGLAFNPTEAKKEFQLAGLTPGSDLKVDLLLANWDRPMLLAQYLQEQLKKNLGISIILNPFDHKTFRSQLELHSYSMYMNSWGADYPDPDNFVSVFLGDSGNNRTEWKNATYDKLVEDARSTQDPAVRLSKYTQAQRILEEDDAIVLPLFYEPNMALVRGRVKGLELNALNYLYLKRVNLD